MDTMKAVVKYGQEDDKVELRDVPVPPTATTTCWRHGGRSLRKRYRDALHRFTYKVNTPVIQGHEFCGVIERTGAAVARWKAGDRVVSETSAYVCGQCRFCRSGNYNMCPNRLGYGYGTNGRLRISSPFARKSCTVSPIRCRSKKRRSSSRRASLTTHWWCVPGSDPAIASW